MPGVILTHRQKVDLIALVGEVIAPGPSATVRRASHPDPGVRVIAGNVKAPISDAERAMWNKVEQSQTSDGAMELMGAVVQGALQDGTLYSDGVAIMQALGMDGTAVADTITRKSEQVERDGAYSSRMSVARTKGRYQHTKGN